ncbi:MAG: hypothetical protein HC812_13375, partial [Leptolyngbya sp. RL_3_1]|nr:hypothetical protein [Leptolyngbya sp. RL_3_1]
QFGGDVTGGTHRAVPQRLGPPPNRALRLQRRQLQRRLNVRPIMWWLTIRAIRL